VLAAQPNTAPPVQQFSLIDSSLTPSSTKMLPTHRDVLLKKRTKKLYKGPLTQICTTTNSFESIAASNLVNLLYEETAEHLNGEPVFSLETQQAPRQNILARCLLCFWHRWKGPSLK
jgi:hypothetical protein